MRASGAVIIEKAPVLKPGQMAQSMSASGTLTVLMVKANLFMLVGNFMMGNGKMV
jgi:hypothetical protein